MRCQSAVGSCFRSPPTVSPHAFPTPLTAHFSVPRVHGLTHQSVKQGDALGRNVGYIYCLCPHTQLHIIHQSQTGPQSVSQSKLYTTFCHLASFWVSILSPLVSCVSTSIMESAIGDSALDIFSSLG